MVLSVDMTRTLSDTFTFCQVLRSLIILHYHYIFLVAMPRSFNTSIISIHSCNPVIIAIYSASVDDKVTVPCFFEPHSTRFHHRRWQILWTICALFQPQTLHRTIQPDHRARNHHELPGHILSLNSDSGKHFQSPLLVRQSDAPFLVLEDERQYKCLAGSALTDKQILECWSGLKSDQILLLKETVSVPLFHGRCRRTSILHPKPI
ncbi:hypothetical protein PsorP6_015368 [Peronosclerospora sorghi]|uniref:Uncharacterized protein n=1 Tax=Peronosclerospora sorghi TaxID=230839 RepID=A0ACC0WQX6_9STRA|nr:hypothetical protein PsorP6_015368 [Peronosclerospora sorghi]